VVTTPAELLGAEPGGHVLWAAITEGRPFRPGPPPFGPSPAELTRLHREGVVALLVGDAYAPADATGAPGIRGAAAALVLPPGAVLAGVAAAWVHGVGGASLAGVCGDPGVDVISPPGLVPRPKSRGWLRIRQFSLADDDRLELGGLAVTTPVRTAVDLTRLVPPAVAVDLLVRLADATGIGPQAVEQRMDRMARFRGIVTAKQILAAWRRTAPSDVAAAEPGQRSPARLPVTR
jgi:hypothetical protein